MARMEDINITLNTASLVELEQMIDRFIKRLEKIAEQWQPANLEVTQDTREYAMSGYPFPLKVPHSGSIRFHELLDELGELHDKKQADYGQDDDPFASVRASAQWNVPAWIGALIRLNDKVVRLQSFAQKGNLVNESAEDSLKDIAVYALIALILMEEESSESE